MTELYFDDLHVGQRFAAPGSVTMDEASIKAYAAQFDPQPFHLDNEAAKGSMFGGLVASGWHTAAVTMKLSVGSSMKLAGGLIGMGGELSWPRATKPGDVLSVSSEIVELKPSGSRPDRGMATVRITTVNQKGEAVQVFTVKIPVPRRTPSTQS